MNEQELLSMLAKALMKSEKAVGTPSTVFGHGPGGLFATPGLDKSLFGAMLLPGRTLESKLPAMPSQFENPVFGIMTGVTATSGDEPTNACDDPPTAGLMKMCTKSAPYGLMSRATRALDIKDFGRLTNRGEQTDLQLFGNPFKDGAQVFGGSSDFSRAAQAEMSKVLFELGVAWNRDFARLIYDGNPTNNTSGGGYKEFWGLDALINTGYRDAETGVLCPAADSIVEDYAGADISADPQGFVKRITYIYRNLKFNARKMGLDPVDIKIAMSWGLFYAITEVWPISYDTYRASGIVPSGANLYIDSAEERKMRDELLNGEYLLIDGQKVGVIVDDSIEETDLGGAFTSSLYFVPMTVLGNQPVTYLEYFNWNAQGGAIAAAKVLGVQGMADVRDNGRFLVVRDSNNWSCVQMGVWTKPRLILRTPYLAARVTSIKYEPLIKERSWDTSNPSYYEEGGRTTSPLPNPSYDYIP